MTIHTKIILKQKFILKEAQARKYYIHLKFFVQHFKEYREWK